MTDLRPRSASRDGSRAGGPYEQFLELGLAVVFELRLDHVANRFEQDASVGLLADQECLACVSGDGHPALGVEPDRPHQVFLLLTVPSLRSIASFHRFDERHDERSSFLVGPAQFVGQDEQDLVG